MIYQSNLCPVYSWLCSYFSVPELVDEIVKFKILGDTSFFIFFLRLAFLVCKCWLFT